MKKSGIITLSIIAIIIALIGVLFGAVFCLRTQTVTILGDSPVAISKENIIGAAGLKNGQSIFMIDKDEATTKIEATFPYVKVVQIKTTSVTEVDIEIRARHEMFYTIYDGKYYILDEELKVLTIKEILKDDIITSVPQLTHIAENSLYINESTKECDFVGTEEQRQATYNLYLAMTNNVKTKEEEKITYYSREDISDIIKFVEFEEYNTFDKIILVTKYGVKFDIENPKEDLTQKMNICLSTMNYFVLNDEDNREHCGVIKIFYDLENVQKCLYIPEVPEETE